MSFLDYLVAELNLHKQNIRRQNALTSTIIIKHTTIHTKYYDINFLHVLLTVKTAYKGQYTYH